MDGGAQEKQTNLNTTNTSNTMSGKQQTGKTNTQQEQMYKGAFMVPVLKDWVFRQRFLKDGSAGSQTLLREHHPEVTRIWVDKRENFKPSSFGDVLRVEITGPNKQVVDECYAEGRQKILDSFGV